jgi:hypothetical protein
MGVYHALHGNTAPDKYLPDGYLNNEPCQPEPMVEPGQIWLVECEAAALSAFHAGLLTRANVVLYERTLLAAVADSLPIGVYAEPLPATGAAGPAIAPRALHFAADGWSVLQLVERRVGRRQLLRSATAELRGPRDGKSPLLAIGTITASRYRQRHDIRTDLAIVAAELGSDELLSLTFAPPGAPSGASPGLRRPAPGQVFTANGLAG